MTLNVQFQMKKGRPTKAFLYNLIPKMLQSMKMGTVSMLQKQIKTRLGESIDWCTIKKYCNLLVDEGTIGIRYKSSNVKEVESGMKERKKEVVVYQLIS